MRVRFGECVLDVTTRQLTRGGEAVHISPKAFDLLVTLIRERPKAMSKEDLHAKLWPTSFVSDASLAMLIAEIRAALGESARQPGAVRTIHRHGYSFQAPAVELPTAADLSPSPEHSDAETAAYWIVFPGRQIGLAPGENIVGRDPNARVWIDSPSVSRRHANVRVHAGRAILEDLDSKNGTFVNDRRLDGTVQPLADGDDVRFGSIGVTFRAWTADPTRTEGDAI
jgi:DNA-binding winged helix-turn-helix (wHTH) protein